MVNELYHAKLQELLLEFTQYLSEHPEFAHHIPKDAQVVLLDKKDPQYSRQAIDYAQRAKSTDDQLNRPIVYIEVTEMAPVRSRLRKLQVFNAPPEYVTV